MKVERSYITVMVISGALAGLVGCSQVLGTRHVVTQDVDAGFGFDAITVALLGRGIAGGHRAGRPAVRRVPRRRLGDGHRHQTPSDVVSVMEPVMVLFIAAPALVRGIFRLKGRGGGSGVGQLAKGWNG